MKSPAERAALDEKFRPVVRAALADGFSKTEVVFLLTRMLPELCDRMTAYGQVVAAYDCAVSTN